jgi:7-carboxy-7-deazaguanine synthase
MSEPSLAVNEIFGPTFQGEGVHLGKPCMFLRLAGCNLSCRWCDTPYAWDWTRFDKASEVKRLTIAEVCERIREGERTGIRHLVISGGEPMLQQRMLAKVIERLRSHGWTTEIETAGTISPASMTLVDHFTVSPKLVNSGDPEAQRYHPEVLERFNTAPSRCFKFVVEKPEDFDEIDLLVSRHQLRPVIIMPEGVDGAVLNTRLKELAAATLLRNYSLTTRLHVLLYGNQRAV